MVDRVSEMVMWALQRDGFSLDNVSRSDTEGRADLRASDSENGYVIEVKSKEDDPQQIIAFNEELETTGSASRSTPMGRVNRLSGLYRDAVKQLRATPHQSNDFHLVW